jgi:glycosyltransferase involved in cell wall biosynthesis
MKKILHITNWYPNKSNDIEAIFIKEQFDLFSKVTDSTLVHVEVRYDAKKWLKFEKIEYSDTETGYYIHTRIKSFRLIEFLTCFLLLYVLKKANYKNYDLLHFHISYPLLTYYHKFKKFINKSIILSEHWSAFHYNFYMPKTTKKLNRIKNIFNQKIPLITVSKALLEDIHEFSGTKEFPSVVIPNVIDYSVYKYKELQLIKKVPVFFIVNSWREIKNPIPMINAFSELKKNRIAFELKIGGYGDYLDKIKLRVEELDMGDCVEFLGKMNKLQIAKQMQNANAYLFSSKYETFSAVCAQALCCGCPIIGPSIPAIQEYAGIKEMINLETDNMDGWIKALKLFIEKQESFNRKEIAKNAIVYLSHEKIQQQYLSFQS